jgi:hypothetical protein
MRTLQRLHLPALLGNELASFTHEERAELALVAAQKPPEIPNDLHALGEQQFRPQLRPESTLCMIALTLDLRVELVEDGIRFLARDAVCFCKLICESEHLDNAGVPSWTRKIMPNVAQIGNTSSHLD